MSISYKNGKATAKGEKPLQTSNNLARLTWLHYFNDYLRDHKIITPEEHRKMRRMIGES